MPMGKLAQKAADELVAAATRRDQNFGAYLKEHETEFSAKFTVMAAFKAAKKDEKYKNTARQIVETAYTQYRRVEQSAKHEPEKATA